MWRSALRSRASGLLLSCRPPQLPFAFHHNSVDISQEMSSPRSRVSRGYPWDRCAIAAVVQCQKQGHSHVLKFLQMRKTSLVPKLVALLGSATASPPLTTATAATPAPTPWIVVKGPDVEAPAVVSLGGSHVLVGAGFTMNGLGCLQNMSIYDAASNTWSASTPLPDGWSAPAMASLGDGAVLASGGQSKGSCNAGSGSSLLQQCSPLTAKSGLKSAVWP